MIYVSGPMSGIAENNFPLFQRVVKSLRDHGLEVVCPTECATCSVGEDVYDNYMRGDLIEMFRKCKGIALIPGWDTSKGATMEAMNALLLKFDFYQIRENATTGAITCDPIMRPRERILAAFMSKWNASFMS